MYTIQILTHLKINNTITLTFSTRTKIWNVHTEI